MLLPWAPWLCLIGGMQGVQSEGLWLSCGSRALHPCLRLPCNKDATARCRRSWSCSILRCFIGMQSCCPCVYVKCFSSILHNSLNEQVTHVACSLLVTYIGLQKAFSKDHCFIHEYPLLCSWIAGSFQCPAWTKLGEVWWLCRDSELFLAFRSLPALGGLNVFNLIFSFIILKIRLPIFFFLPLFRKA